MTSSHVPNDDEVETPIPFGWRSSWLAVKASDAGRVIEQLGLLDVSRSGWSGVEAAYAESGRAFVTPPIDGWVLVHSGDFTAFADAVDEPSIVAELSRIMGTSVVLFFCDRRSASYGWTQAEQGRLVRAYFEVEGEVSTDVGDDDVEAAELAASRAAPDDDGAMTKQEALVFRLAARWSVDPHTLDQRGALPRGWLATLPD